MSDEPLVELAEEVWVTIPEAVLLFGYDRTTLSRLARDMAKKPEDQREIRIRRRLKLWELWLPDLFIWVVKYGPRTRRKKDS